MSSAAEYQYDEIAPPWIRILHLNPRAGDTRLAGTLRKMSLESPNSFDAISYACGEDKYDHQIFIDGKTVMITKNCHDGLCHLRDQLGVRKVWVDAVSINAGNKDERSKQLLLMTDIYGVARRVFIWLGWPTTASDQALDWLNDTSITEHVLVGARLALFPDALRPREIRRALPVFVDVIRARMRRLGLTTPLPCCGAEPVQDITDRQWFTRQWTIQEAAMASDAWVVCGTKILRWNRLVWGLVKAYEQNLMGGQITKIEPMRVMFMFWTNITSISSFKVWPHRRWLNNWFSSTSAFYGTWTTFLDYMEDYGWNFVNAQLILTGTIAMTRLLEGLRPLDSTRLLALIVLSFMTVVLSPPKNNPLWDASLRKGIVDVLHQTRRQQAKMKKDKVYALYGLLQQIEVGGLETPNYDDRHSLEDTYRCFTISIIQWHRSLELLLEASGPWGADAPSWVPDWSMAYKRVQFSRAEVGSPPADMHSAFTFSKDLRQLTVSGRRIGAVVFTAAPIEGEFGSLNQICENAMTLRTWLKRAVDMYGLSAHDVCRFLVSALPEKNCSDDDLRAWAEDILEDSHSVLEDERGDSDGDGDPSTLRPPGTRVADEIRMLGLHRRPGLDGTSWRRLLNLAANQKTWRLHTHIITNLYGGLAPFVAQITDSEKFVFGIGPEKVQIGDVVVRFVTPGVPMVLRPKTPSVETAKFHLIGAARVSQMVVSTKPESQVEGMGDDVFTII